jgi:hypothetical protein
VERIGIQISLAFLEAYPILVTSAHLNVADNRGCTAIA